MATFPSIATATDRGDERWTHPFLSEDEFCGETNHPVYAAAEAVDARHFDQGEDCRGRTVERLSRLRTCSPCSGQSRLELR